MSHEHEVEKRIQEKGLVAPRLKPEDIDALIVSDTYMVTPSGKCMVCELTLVNGYTVRGEASTVSKANFDEEIGKKVSYKNARDRIWSLEGYLLQEKLYWEGNQ